LKREEIFEYAWDEPYMGETKTLDVHISNIRKKIKEVSEKEYIETVWGIGYRLHP
jgi:DNA-binding response OmpR family regulator